MNTLYRKALANELRSRNTGDHQSISVKNTLPIPVHVAWIDRDGRRQDRGVVKPAHSWKQKTSAGNYFVVTSATSGAFVMAIEVGPHGVKETIEMDDLIAPNDFGAPPHGGGDTFVPDDGPLILVGAVEYDKHKVLLRQQRWVKTSDSYSVPAHGSHEVSVTTTAGMSKTSSSLKTVAASVGGSASGGWGPISMSINTSLSMTSTVQTEINITEEHTKTELATLSNPSDQTVMVLYWQIEDRLAWWKVDDHLKPLCALDLMVPPAIAFATDAHGRVVAVDEQRF